MSIKRINNEIKKIENYLLINNLKYDLLNSSSSSICQSSAICPLSELIEKINLCICCYLVART